MTDFDTQEVDLELVVIDSRSEYLKPNLELLEAWSNIIGVSIPIGP
jgi:hypothetical protein